LAAMSDLVIPRRRSRRIYSPAARLLLQEASPNMELLKYFHRPHGCAAGRQSAAKFSGCQQLGRRGSQTPTASPLETAKTSPLVNQRSVCNVAGSLRGEPIRDCSAPEALRSASEKPFRWLLVGLEVRDGRRATRGWPRCGKLVTESIIETKAAESEAEADAGFQTPVRSRPLAAL
jgi:hypothetical protein